MQHAEMIWVLKVLNTIILFDPSLDLSLSSHLLQHLLTLQIWLSGGGGHS